MTDLDWLIVRTLQRQPLSLMDLRRKFPSIEAGELEKHVRALSKDGEITAHCSGKQWRYAVAER